MEYMPLNYEKINFIAGTYTPSTVKPCNNQTYAYWCRSLTQRAMSVISIENMPSNWHGNVKDFLYFCLFKWGHVAMFKSNRFGLSFQPCTLRGYDFYYQPTEAQICNPKLDVTLRIHKECEILKICPDFMGIWDIIDRYARRLSELDPAIDMSIINAKFSLILGASNKAGAKFLEKMVDKVNEGNPAVIFDTSVLLPADPTDKQDIIKDFSRDVKSTYIGTDLLKDFVSILNEFDTEIGIPTLPYEKRERMVTSEAKSKEADATSRSKIWVDTMNECFTLINPLLGTNMIAVHNYMTEETSEEVSEDE